MACAFLGRYAFTTFATMSNPLAIVVVHWNDNDTTTQCLNMLAQWTKIDSSVFVVDNASTEPYRLPSSANLKMKLIASPSNLGYAGGNNLGIKIAREEQFDYVLLLNTDVIVKEETVSAMMQMMDKNIRLGAVGPALIEGEEVHHGGRNIAWHQNTRINVEKDASLRKEEKIAYIPGTIILIRNSVFDFVGYLDEQYFFSGEIADFCHRIQEVGLQLFVLHDQYAEHGKDGPEIDRGLTNYYVLRNRFLYIQKHHSSNLKSLKRKWILIGLRQMMGALATLDIAHARAIYYALADGILGKFGNMNHRFIS